jgi:hypothetical protein
MKPEDLIGAIVVLNQPPFRGQQGEIRRPLEAGYGDDSEPHHSHLQKTLYAVWIQELKHETWAYGHEFGEVKLHGYTIDIAASAYSEILIRLVVDQDKAKDVVQDMNTVVESMNGKYKPYRSSISAGNAQEPEGGWESK